MKKAGSFVLEFMEFILLFVAAFVAYIIAPLFLFHLLGVLQGAPPQ